MPNPPQAPSGASSNVLDLEGFYEVLEPDLKSTFLHKDVVDKYVQVVEKLRREMK